MDQETIDVYQAKATEYASLEIDDSYLRGLKAFLDKLKPGGLVLDLGCGPGVYAAMMLDEGFRVHAIDATPAFVDASIARGVQARVGQFEDIEGEDIYDGIWASFSLLHAPRADFGQHLARLATALKPGGVFYLGMKLGEGEARDPLGRKYSYFTEQELHDHLKAVGLSPETIYLGEGPGFAGATSPYALILADA